MSSTAVVDRPMIPEYLEALVRRNKRKVEGAPVECNDVPPQMPARAFITADDEVIECEA